MLYSHARDITGSDWHGAVISASDDRYRDLSSEAGPQEVPRSRMPKLKAEKGSVFT